MKIVIASGKGGTGKTTVAVNLAVLCAEEGQKVSYVDCDVEEPNGHLFLKPSIHETESIGVLVPEVNPDLCDGCGKCGEICRFNAIVVLVGKPVTFPGLCHSCGGCSLVCSPRAIEEVERPVGVVETGQVGDCLYRAGKLQVGEAMPTPLIRAVKKNLPTEGHTIIDAPPGTSCSVVETVKESDFVILVTEPTPFGLNDLKLAVDMIRRLRIRYAVLLNRAGSGDDRIYDYCREEAIELLAEIPDDRRIAEAYSRGELVIHALSEYREVFKRIIRFVENRIRDYSSNELRT